jgi:hypothetical protein
MLRMGELFQELGWTVELEKWLLLIHLEMMLYVRVRMFQKLEKTGSLLGGDDSLERDDYEVCR